MYFYLLQVNLLQCVSLIALSYILEYTIENINAMLDSIPKSEQSQIVTEKSTNCSDDLSDSSVKCINAT